MLSWSFTIFPMEFTCLLTCPPLQQSHLVLSLPVDKVCCHFRFFIIKVYFPLQQHKQTKNQLEDSKMQPWQKYYIFVELKKLTCLWFSFSEYLTCALTVISALVGNTKWCLKKKIHLLGGHIGLLHLSAMNILILLLDIFPYKNNPREEMWKKD